MGGPRASSEEPARPNGRADSAAGFRLNRYHRRLSRLFHPAVAGISLIPEERAGNDPVAIVLDLVQPLRAP
jgi:hypothetical protein